MKKTFVYILLLFFAASCSKTEMQQTDTIKSADSLFKSAKDGFKTLDSISKIVQDSAKFNKVVVPEIEKRKKGVENIIRENAKSLDSINSVLKKSKEQIEKSTDLIKTVDSAGKVLKDTKNPIDALSTISKTLEKVTKSNKTAEQKKQPSTENQPKNPVEEKPQDNSVSSTPEINRPEATPIPMYKNGKMELQVENITTARDEIAMELRKNGGEILSENFGEQQNERKQIIKAKIPYQYFDQVSNSISQNVGSLRSKNVETVGSDFNSSQMCDLDIVLTQNLMAGTENISTPDNQKTSVETDEKGFIERFGITGIIIAVSLVLIPLMLLILYLMNRNMKKKMEDQLNAQNLHERNRAENFQKTENIETKPSEPKNENEDPYEKYKPKF